MSGRLIAIVGPSGVGKDSVMQEAAARDPRIIVCDISGYGDSGPYVEKKAYDLLIQAAFSRSI